MCRALRDNLLFFACDDQQNTRRGTSAAPAALTGPTPLACTLHTAGAKPDALSAAARMFTGHRPRLKRNDVVCLQHLRFCRIRPSAWWLLIPTLCLPAGFPRRGPRARGPGIKEMGSVLGTGPDFRATLAGRSICAPPPLSAMASAVLPLSSETQLSSNAVSETSEVYTFSF